MLRMKFEEEEIVWLKVLTMMLRCVMKLLRD